MRSFTSIDAFQTRRGPCFIVAEWVGTRETWDPSSLIGETVLLDGVEVFVRGVEKTLQYISPGQPYRGSLALLL
jgi:hypothetical protein